MSADSQIPVFFINMEDAADRRGWFEAQASRLGLVVTRVAAVVGRELPTETLDRLKASIQSGTPLGPSEIGCFLSHRKAWEQVLASGVEWAFVAEDDLHLADGAAVYFHSTGWIPDDAELIKAETTFRRCHMAREGSLTPDGRSVHRLFSLHGGAGGYFICRKAAQGALDLTRDICEPADHVLFNPDFGFFDNHVTYQIDPDCGVTRKDLVSCLDRHGIEARPIVAGNFAKNEVVTRYMDHEIHGGLPNAELADTNGLFIGNHHYPLDKPMEQLAVALKAALG